MLVGFERYGHLHACMYKHMGHVEQYEKLLPAVARCMHAYTGTGTCVYAANMPHIPCVATRLPMTSLDLRHVVHYCMPALIQERYILSACIALYTFVYSTFYAQARGNNAHTYVYMRGLLPPFTAPHIKSFTHMLLKLQTH